MSEVILEMEAYVTMLQQPNATERDRLLAAQLTVWINRLKRG